MILELLERVFTTVPIGPAIQALYSSHDVADNMHCPERRLAANLEHI